MRTAQPSKIPVHLDVSSLRGAKDVTKTPSRETAPAKTKVLDSPIMSKSPPEKMLPKINPPSMAMVRMLIMPAFCAKAPCSAPIAFNAGKIYPSPDPYRTMDRT